VAALVIPLVVGEWKPLVSLGLLLALWIVMTTALSLSDTIATAGSMRAAIAISPRRRSYYGMQLAHVGVAVTIVGITIVTGYEAEKDLRMDVGDVVHVAAYDFRFMGVKEASGPNYVAAQANIEVSSARQKLRQLHPEKRVYYASGNAMTETAIDSGVFGDLYVSLGEPLDGRAWRVRIQYKPFVGWIWGGAMVMAIGGGLAVSDRRYMHAPSRQAEAA
jgi:cytochrome c-type biogenesis protein CcmF